MVKEKDKIKILINNVVPLNNGDVALFRSLFQQLEIAGYAVQIATYSFKLAVKKYPNLPFVKELGQSRIFVKLPPLKQLLLPFMFLCSKPYRNADIIIGAPGGYINSFYSIKNSLLIYKIANFFGKKTAIYSQSVGPLNKNDRLLFKRLMKKSISFIYVRDRISNELLNQLDIDKDRFKLTKDAAFLIDYKESRRNNHKKIAISVREWNYDCRSMAAYKEMISCFVIIAIDRGFCIDFLSTCQGEDGYKNDALLAQEIYNDLDSRYQDKIEVLNDYYLFDDFYKKIEDYEFVIGTRLHMCILAMTKGIPAFNISYEIKGKECYDYLGFSEYTVDFNENLESAKTSFNNFIENVEIIRNELNIIIPKLNKESVSDFQFFMDKIIE